MVTIEYRPREGLHDELLAELEDARFSRRRTGASAWRVWQDAADPGRIVEQFVVASWDETCASTTVSLAATSTGSTRSVR